MNLAFYKPRNQILQKYIKGYYFITDDHTDKSLTYRTFPNNYTILSSNQNANVVLSENKIAVVPSAEKKISTNLVFRYTNPIEIYYDCSINEITLYFKPLGLNHFFDGDLDFFLHGKNLEHYNPYPDFKEKMEDIFNCENREEQIDKLESYWLSKLLEKDFVLLREILTAVEQEIKINDIAKKHHFTRQYINKLFTRNLGKSPTEYRKIHRFRNAMQMRNHSRNLSALSHETLFYDQSHFIKDFKELSHLAPGAFFKTVNTHNENIWLFI